MGILYLFTLGLFCIGWWVDIYRICVDKFIKNPVFLPPATPVANSDHQQLQQRFENEDFYNFLDHHEKQMMNLAERYTDACLNVSDICTDSDNPKFYILEKRLSAIQSAIDIYDRMYSFCCSNGGGERYLHDYYENYIVPYYSGYHFNGLQEDFSTCDFECYDFLQFLHDTYITNYSEYDIYLKNLQQK